MCMVQCLVEIGASLNRSKIIELVKTGKPGRLTGLTGFA